MKSVAVIVQDGFSPFEFGVACEAFGLDRTDDDIPNFDFRVCAVEPGLVPSNVGFAITVEHGLDAAADADIVIVTPLPRDRWNSIDLRVARVVRDAAARDAWVLSECSGAFVLAAAGILSGGRATTHWKYVSILQRMYPDIEVDPDALYVQRGKIVTSAGTAAGLDACLHVLRQELGAEKTNRIARRMVVSPQRDGGQAQFIENPLPVAASQSLAPVIEWMAANLARDLTVDQLAARAHLSPRTFARRFRAELGTTPAAWLARQRVLEAQRMLEATDAGIDQIAAECGFGTAAVMRQSFARLLGTTPSAYRARFAATSATPAGSLAHS